MENRNNEHKQRRSFGCFVTRAIINESLPMGRLYLWFFRYHVDLVVSLLVAINKEVDVKMKAKM